MLLDNISIKTYRQSHYLNTSNYTGISIVLVLAANRNLILNTSNYLPFFSCNKEDMYFHLLLVAEPQKM